MNETTARELARRVIRPCGLLGYLTGRGTWWRDEGHRKRGQRAVGQVMGSAYLLLAPVWKQFPSLDPGQIRDPLDLANQANSLQDTPEDLRSLLSDLDEAIRSAVPVLAEQFSGFRKHVESATVDLDAAIDETRRVLREKVDGDDGCD